MPTISIGRYSSCLGPIRLSDGSHESSVLSEHTPAATAPYLGLGAEISLVGYVLKTPPVGILDVPKKKDEMGPPYWPVLWVGR